MTRNIILVLSVTSLLTPALFTGIGKAADGQLELSIEEGIVMVLENNLDIVIERISPKVEEARIRKEEGAFDRTIFASLEWEDSTTPLNARSTVAAGGRTEVESEAYTADMGLKSLTRLGTEYTLEVSDKWRANTFNFFDFEHDTFAGLRITQPLLKDYGPEVNLFRIELAGKDRDISLHRLKEKILNTVASFELAYWDLVLAREELGVKRESLKLADSLLDLTQKKFEAEVVSRLELTQAEAGVASRKEALISAQKTVWERENELKLFISGDVYLLTDVEIIPKDPLILLTITPALDESIKKALELRPDYLEAKGEIEKKDLEIRFSENQVFPEIDIEASLGYNGFGVDFGDSIDNLENNPTWTVGVVFSYPLGNNTARSDLKIARMEAEEAILRLKRLEQVIILNLDIAIKDMETSRERYEAAKVSTMLAEDALEAEEVKLEAGLSTTHNVLEFQEELEEARTVEIAALIDYKKALTGFFKQEGSLLVEKGIEIAGEDLYRHGGKVNRF
jgi:outer membrane protein TolC